MFSFKSGRNEANVKLIEEQKEIIARQNAEIDHLLCLNEELQDSLNKVTRKAEWTQRTITESSRYQEVLKKQNEQLLKEPDRLRTESESYQRRLGAAVDMLAEYRADIEVHKEQIEVLTEQLNIMNKPQEITNFPNDLLQEFSKLKYIDPYVETCLEDEIFRKELAKRLMCNICDNDIERLRCSKCLKGICKGCHEQVESCPNCRNENTNFQNIIMSRL